MLIALINLTASNVVLVLCNVHLGRRSNLSEVEVAADAAAVVVVVVVVVSLDESLFNVVVDVSR